jgi:hypothetical protein
MSREALRVGAKPHVLYGAATDSGSGRLTAVSLSSCSFASLSERSTRKKLSIGNREAAATESVWGDRGGSDSALLLLRPLLTRLSHCS